MRTRQEAKTHLGTWGRGPFESDTAADWCANLNDAPRAQRAQILRAALLTVVNYQGYLPGDTSVEALAAAAVLASQRPGGAPITSPYAPEDLYDGGAWDLPSDLDDLAVRALNRIVADQSEWCDLWALNGLLADAVAEVQAIRRTLAA